MLIHKYLIMRQGFLRSSVLVFVFLVFTFVIASSFIFPHIFRASYSSDTLLEEKIASSSPSFVVTHIDTPEPLKAIYMTACVAGVKSLRDSLKSFVENTELNAIVIDVKDYSGTVSILGEGLQEGDATGCKVPDLKEFIGELHKSDIYTIARVTVFQDPYYTKLHPELAVRSKSTGGVWKDRKGLAFIDVGAKDYWDYIIKLSKVSYDIGFDEVNFDYIRYPTDGDMKDAHYSLTVGTSTRSEMLESFFSYLHKNLKDVGVKTSADLFGLTTLASDDMGIGQVLEKALPYFDFIYPMVYPSHYAWNTGGFGDPATHPYEIVKYSMDSALLKEQAYRIALGLSTSTPSQIRPWLQDFDLGADYDTLKIQAQIKATYDSGVTGWLMWDASNKYTREAYLPAQTGLQE